MTAPDRAGAGIHRSDAVLMAAGFVALLVCWTGHRAQSANARAFAEDVVRTRQMNADAEQIEFLRTAPRLATERVRPNDELIAQVEAAMSVAGVPGKNWVANEPVPVVRLPQSPYQQLSLRLGFADISLRQVVEFAHAIMEKDSGLSITRLRLSGATNNTSEQWNAELVLSYLVYSPQ